MKLSLILLSIFLCLSAFSQTSNITVKKRQRLDLYFMQSQLGVNIDTVLDAFARLGFKPDTLKKLKEVECGGDINIVKKEEYLMCSLLRTDTFDVQVTYNKFGHVFAIKVSTKKADGKVGQYFLRQCQESGFSKIPTSTHNDPKSYEYAQKEKEYAELYFPKKDFWYFALSDSKYLEE